MRHLRCLTSALLGLLLGYLPFSLAAAPDRLHKVLDSSQLRVCIWPDYYGITYRNPKTHELRGIDIDIATALGQELQVGVVYVDSDFPALVDDLLADKCDIAMHAVGITPERSAKLVFSRSYLRSDIYAVTTASGAAIQSWTDLDQPGRVIAVQVGTVMEPVMRRTLKHATLMLVKPPMKRENEVESGRADAFMTDFPYSRRMLDLTTWARLVAPPRPFHLTDYAFAFAPGDASLLKRVNQFLTTIKADRRLLRFAQNHKLESIVVLDAGDRAVAAD